MSPDAFTKATPATTGVALFIQNNKRERTGRSKPVLPLQSLILKHQSH